MSTLEASRMACATVIVDWKPRGVRDMLAFTSSNFIGLMEDGCSVLKYPCYPDDQESMNALQEEAYRYRYLGQHDNLVTFKEMSDDGLVLEYCEKGALCDVVSHLNEDQKIAIGEQIARGLVHLHNRNYIHGDLNTQNVFVTSDWTAKIGDLQGQLNDSEGNIKIPARAENNAKSRLPGPGPDDDFSFQTDIFAFGTLLYHVWYGHPPYPELHALRDGDEITARYSRGEFPIDAHAVGLEQVIWRCWHSTYASASEILEDISSLSHPDLKGSISEAACPWLSTVHRHDSAPAFVIYINGWPGVGKFTVAQKLRSRIAGSCILHNHELIDPVEERYSRTSPEYDYERALYRRARLREVAERPRTVYIFTDAQTEYNTCVNDYLWLARAPHNRRFYSIVLDCELEENVRRLTDSLRSKYSKGKLTDPKVLQIYRQTMEIYRFGNEDELVLDVTDMAAEVVAAKIAEFVNLRECCAAPDGDISSTYEK